MLMLLLFSLLWTSPTLAAEPCPNGAPLAFEGAEGFGRCTQGGRGGRTIEVTNLNDSGPGSLRQCAEVETGPRSCVFRIAGTIVLNSLQNIEIVHPSVTIDGSTAPGGGIALKDAGITVRASHVILRHLRVRPGPARHLKKAQNANGFTLRSNDGGAISDVIIDHSSVSWGTDDLINIVFGTDNVTVQWSIFSEGLICEPQVIGCGSRGFLMGYGARGVSFHHNLSAHNWIRWPEYTGGGDKPGLTGQLDFVNNVHYNGNGTDTIMWGAHGPQYANFVGNYWKQGLDGSAAMPQNQVYPSIRTIGQRAYALQSGIFVADNYGRFWPTPCAGCRAVIGQAVPDTKIIWGDNGGIPVATVRYPYPLVPTTSAVQAYDDVLAGAGAFPRDSVDTRVVNDVREGTGHWLEWSKTPLTAASWPDLTGGTTPPLDTDGDGVPDGSDQCPTVAGPVSNQGCPVVVPPPPPLDTDGDGFPDSVDLCPAVPGVAPNGCPVIVPPPPPPPPPPSKFGVTEHTERKVIVSGTAADCPGGITNTSRQTKDAAGKMITKTVTVACRP